MKLKFKVEKRRMKEKSVRFVVFGLVLVLLASGIGTVSAFSNSGDGDWKYYKEITVKEISGKTLTDFQVLVELNAANFPATAKSDGSDLRFEDASGKELSYWIEEWNYGAKEAKIWVKVPSIPANGETKIKMYYGNPSAGAVSDGDNVFEFFDDFESYAIGSNLNGQGGWTVSGGRSEFTIQSDRVKSGSKSLRVKNVNQLSTYAIQPVSDITSKAFHFSVQNDVIVNDNHHYTRFLITQNEPQYESWKLGSYNGRYQYFQTVGTPDSVINIAPMSADTWYNIKIYKIGASKYRVKVNGKDKGEFDVLANPTNANYFCIADVCDNHADQEVAWWDDVRVRKYTPSEPTLTISAEIPMEIKPKFEISGPHIIPKYLSPNLIVENALLGTYIDNEIKLGISNDEYAKKVICKFKSPAGFIAVQELELSKTGGLVKADGYEYYNYEGEIKARSLKPLIGWLISFFSTGFSSHADAHEALIDFTPPVTLEKVIITDVYGAEHELDVNKPLVSIEDQIFNPSPINPAFWDYKYVATYSPVHILMTDEEGNKIGWEEGNEFKEIENAVYSGADIHPEFIIIFQPKLTYSLNVSGVKSGDFTLHIVSANATAKTVSKFENISATANTKAFIQITEKGQEMSVDYDGDGKIDEEKEPVSEVIEVIPEIPTPSPSPTPTPTPPGFEVIFAIAGLLAVAYVLRRKK
jgi:PGF-CTERM protein